MARYGVGSWGSRTSKTSLAHRQGGTGSTWSGMQEIVRHYNDISYTIADGETQAINLVAYNPTNHSTPVALDGSSTKVLNNNFTTDGSRVDYVTVMMTIRQADTSGNNTVYTGSISTSFNEGQLSAALMTTNFNDFITSNANGEMGVDPNPQTYNMQNYLSKDIQQHNIRGLFRNQMQLYSGRVVQANQVIPLPRKNRRQQPGSIYSLVIMNDSSGDQSGSDIEVQVQTFFKEILAS